MYISKEEVRDTMKQYRNKLASDEVTVLSRNICNNIIDSELISSSVKYLLSFASFRNEPDTELIDIMVRKKYPDINIAYPKINAQRNKMNFYIVNSYSELESGYMNIAEPDPEHSELLTTEVINDHKESVIIIVPGLAYDMTGKRAGYGGGYYDRYLNMTDGILKIGICYDMQLLADRLLKCDEYDIGVDYIITDSEVLHCRK